jgi:hypothetical protein
MKITRWSLLTATLFLALTMSGGVYAQRDLSGDRPRHNVNSDAEFGWRVEDNKRTTMGAGTAVLKDDQLQRVTPGNPVSFDARPVDVSQPVAARPGSPVGTNLGGAQGARNTNTAPPVVIPVIPASVVPALPVIK